MKTTSPYKTIVSLMPPAIRRRFYAAFLLVGVVGVLEVFSLSALLAFFTVGLSGAENPQTEPLISWIGVSGVTPSSALLTVVLGLFVIKAFVILIVGRHSYHTSTAAKRYFQERLFEGFLHSPFQAQANKSSADLVRSVTADCNALEGRFFVPMLVLLGEIIPALCICILLLIVNPTAFGVAFCILGVCGVSVFMANNNRLARLGQAQQTADGHIVQSAQHGFHGLRELTIYNLKAWAQQRFEAFTRASARAIEEALFISLLPRFVFEVTIYIVVGIVVIIYAIQGTPLTQIVGELVVFGAAAMRLLPSVSKVVVHLQSLNHARPAVVSVTDALRSPVVEGGGVARELSSSLEFSDIALMQASFAYGERVVLQSLDLEIFAGDSLGVVGASGSGKSTLINLILGLLTPTEGQVKLNGIPLAGREAQWWACVGYVAQEPFLMDVSATVNVMLGCSRSTNKDIVRAQDLMAGLGLPVELSGSSMSVGEGGMRLSGGQRQRLAIARALYRNPQVLILDEATSAMDVHTQAKVMDIVTEYMNDRTLVIITHRAEPLAYCNKILTLPDGGLVLSRKNNA